MLGKLELYILMSKKTSAVRGMKIECSGVLRELKIGVSEKEGSQVKKGFCYIGRSTELKMGRNEKIEVRLGSVKEVKGGIDMYEGQVNRKEVKKKGREGREGERGDKSREENLKPAITITMQLVWYSSIQEIISPHRKFRIPIRTYPA